MKITEKIVTSVTQPQHTNVLWHNPETGELKMFGNKGWEVVGGTPGNDSDSGDSECSGTCGGYPICYPNTLLNTYTVLLPNTYNKISADKAGFIFHSTNLLPALQRFFTSSSSHTEIEILIPNFILLKLDGQKMFAGQPYLMLTLITICSCPGIYCKVTTSTNQEDGLFAYVGIMGTLVGFALLGQDDWLRSNNETIGVLYYHKQTGSTSIILYFTDDKIYHFGNNMLYYSMGDDLPMVGETFTNGTIEIDGTLLYKCTTHLGYITLVAAYMGISQKDIEVYADTLSIGGKLHITIPGMDSLACDISSEFCSSKLTNNTEEYIIDFCGTNMGLGAPVVWTNDNPPTFDGTTRHVISILDGVGCYTVTSIEETT